MRSEQRYTRVKKLFVAVRDLSPSEQDAYLEQACGDDLELRREIASLLVYDDSSETAFSDISVALVADVFAPGTILAERYRVVSRLGEGAMGVVYRADDLVLGVGVALKFLPAAMAGHPDLVQRLLNEVRLARRVTHPHVCRVFDVGEALDERFLSMEHIDGEDLSLLLGRIDRLPQAKAAEIGRQVAEGLAAAHGEGVLHRDLKPANVMLDARGRARITDFGLASLTDKTHGLEIRSGTPAYMAPEQHFGEEVTEKSDLYALGVLLYEVTTGRRPFEADSLAGLAYQHLETVPDPPSRWLEHLDPVLERTILHCLKKDPGDRPASASAVASALAGEASLLGWRPAVGEAVAGRAHFDLVRKLGEGGFGEVWLAGHQKTGERRVFKFCFDARRLRALQREVTLFRLLKEELGDRGDIVRVLDWSFEEPPFFIESEYTAGGNLGEWIASQGGMEKVSIEARLELVAQVAEALAAAHSVGVLHKDVKPANVLVHVDGERVEARLADFGIGLVTDSARLEQAGITQLGMTLSTTQRSSSSGTPLYRAPELVEGKMPSVQADVYAVGVMLYQMIVGDLHRALGAGWERDVEDQLLRQDVALAVDVDPGRRLGDARSLAIRLRTLGERQAEHEAQRQAEEAVATLQRLRRRRRLLAAAVAVLALFAVVVSYQAWRIAQAAQRVRQEAATSRQVERFLVELFEVSDPFRTSSFKTSGHEVTAREILDQGAQRIDEKLEQQPEIRARLMHTLGVVYRGLGLYDQAAALHQQALSLRRQIPGDLLSVAESLYELAFLATLNNDPDKGEPLARESLELRRRWLGDEHPQVADSLRILGILLRSKGQYEAAEPLLRQALAIHRQTGEDPSEVAWSLLALGDLLKKKGDYAAAELSMREALTLNRQLLGQDHPMVASMLTQLADLLRQQGDDEAAEPLLREALTRQRQLLGNEHPQVAITLMSLALVLRRKGATEAAEALFREVLAMNRRLLGDEHPDVARALVLLAWSLREKDDEAAVEMYQEALLIQRRRLGDEHPFVARTLRSLGELHQERRRYETAEPLLIEALVLRRQLLSDEHPDVVDSLESLVALYEDWDQPTKAVEYRKQLPQNR